MDFQISKQGNSQARSQEFSEGGSSSRVAQLAKRSAIMAGGLRRGFRGGRPRRGPPPLKKKKKRERERERERERKRERERERERRGERKQGGIDTFNKRKNVC